ncbi:GNAT family N-acetyltransferase [Glycomyces sp. A-F 0318]|nr:GNAT family N-acetyltransferase [Glycomyces amatae]
MAAAHPRDFPHLHLHSIATVPWLRGEGAGGALLAERLRLADEEGLPVYLEASTARSARLYERAGFAAAGAPIALPGGGPELVPMWRR